MGLSIKNFSVLLIALFSLNLQASEVVHLPFSQTFNEDLIDAKSDLDYFTIASVEVQKIEDTYEAQDQKFLVEASASLGQIITVVDQLIALGKKIWPIIEAGRPVINTAMNTPISVLPKADMAPEEAFYQMSNWSIPKSETYKVSYKNLLGGEVISFAYTVIYQYGGQFEDKGSYLTGVTVTASQVYVAWGFSFDASSALLSISNLGSRQEPVAGATIKVDYKAKSMFTEIQTSESFFVSGRGQSQKL